MKVRNLPHIKRSLVGKAVTDLRLEGCGVAGTVRGNEYHLDWDELEPETKQDKAWLNANMPEEVKAAGDPTLRALVSNVLDAAEKLAFAKGAVIAFLGETVNDAVFDALDALSDGEIDDLDDAVREIEEACHDR